MNHEIDSAVHESQQIIPSLRVRPHHFFTEYFLNSVTGRESPQVSAQIELNRFKNGEYSEYDTGSYVPDVIGSSQEEELFFQNNLEKYLEAIRDLPDDSYIHIDIGPDGECESCIIGNHCKAYGIQGSKTFSVVEYEKSQLGEIRMFLELSGYRLGEDFFERLTNHILYPLKGGDIAELDLDKAQEVFFNSILVKTEAVRDLFNLLYKEDDE